jgi:hypothetical protein
LEIIAKAPGRKNLAAYRQDVASAILGTIARRPCTAYDLTQILGTQVNEINKYLETLESEQKIGHVRKKWGVFYFWHCYNCHNYYLLLFFSLKNCMNCHYK